MKRILVAAGLAVAALSLPATAALADGYEQRRVVKAKPKPKAKPKAKRHARKHHAKPHHDCCMVRDYAKVYGAHGGKVVHVEKHVESSRSYYEERDGRVVAHYGSWLNPAQGCYPNAPCTWGYGPAHPPAVSPGWGWWGHPGGVGYGVDGGYHGGAVYVVPGGAWSTGHARSAAHASSMSKSWSWHGGSMGGHHKGGGHMMPPGHHMGPGHMKPGHHMSPGHPMPPGHPGPGPMRHGRPGY